MIEGGIFFLQKFRSRHTAGKNRFRQIESYNGARAAISKHKK